MDKTADVIVAGAGIFGLSCAYACLRRGLSVRVFEARSVGAGASGGIVGALSPHVPDQWNPKKQFQLDALLSAEAHWAEVDATSGLSSGYRRSGRLMPILSQEALRLGKERSVNAERLWAGQAEWSVQTTGDDWLADQGFGLIHDSLSARLMPRDACRSLAGAITRLGGQIACDTPVEEVTPGRVRASGETYSARAIILAAGVAGLEHLASGRRGVKGQAALLRAAGLSRQPTIFSDGIYIIPHEGDRVAVGSTSENAFDDPDTTDALLDDLIAKARALCPALTDAPVIERWAGVRPKAPRRDPMLGELPDMPGVFVANGAFKIGFGIAHKVGEALAEMVTGGAVPLPPSFSVRHHLA